MAAGCLCRAAQHQPGCQAGAGLHPLRADRERRSPCFVEQVSRWANSSLEAGQPQRPTAPPCWPTDGAPGRPPQVGKSYPTLMRLMEGSAGETGPSCYPSEATQWVHRQPSAAAEACPLGKPDPGVNRGHFWFCSLPTPPLPHPQGQTHTPTHKGALQNPSRLCAMQRAQVFPLSSVLINH